MAAVLAAVEPGGNILPGFKDFRTKNGSSQGQNLALTVLLVPNSFDSGTDRGLSRALAGLDS